MRTVLGILALLLGLVGLLACVAGIVALLIFQPAIAERSEEALGSAENFLDSASDQLHRARSGVQIISQAATPVVNKVLKLAATPPAELRAEEIALIQDLHEKLARRIDQLEALADFGAV